MLQKILDMTKSHEGCEGAVESEIKIKTHMLEHQSSMESPVYFICFKAFLGTL